MTDTEQMRNGAARVVVPLALLAWIWLWMTHPGWIDLFFGAVLLVCVADIVIYDWAIMIVPDRSVAGMFAAGWLYTAATGVSAEGTLSASAILGEQPLEHLKQSVVLGGSAWLLALVYRLARRRPGLGLGDIKLIAAAGAWLPVLIALDAITLAALGALAALIVLAVIRGVKTGLSLAIPFAVFLAPAFWVMWALSR